MRCCHITSITELLQTSLVNMEPLVAEVVVVPVAAAAVTPWRLDMRIADVSVTR